MPSAVSLRIPDDLSKRLDNLARKTGRSKTFYMIEAITEKIEDLEDYYIALEISQQIKAGKERTWTLDEVERDLGLAD